VADINYEEQWQQAFGIDNEPVRKHLFYPLLDEKSGNLSGKNILDAGCGNGNLLHHLSLHDFAKGFGVDKSSKFIDVAQKSVQDGRIQFIQADLQEQLPFEDEFFDVAYSIFVLDALPELNFHFKELSRVLRSGGQLLIITRHPFNPMYYYLYEKFTGKQNDRFIGVKGYFDHAAIQYVFTTGINATTTIFQHTFEDNLNPIVASNMDLRELLELKTDNPNFKSMPSLWETRDIPRYLFIRAQKR
jgi:ubiquinone/menaquinone biosynthesis C-methylase UbiE